MRVQRVNIYLRIGVRTRTCAVTYAACGDLQHCGRDRKANFAILWYFSFAGCRTWSVYLFIFFFSLFARRVVSRICRYVYSNCYLFMTGAILMKCNFWVYREWLLVMYKLLRIINSVDRIIKSLSYITCVPQFSYF